MRVDDISRLVMPGDIFASRGTGAMSVLIRFGQWLEDCGEKAPFNHIGGFIAATPRAKRVAWFSTGETIESKTLIGRYHISDYIGKEIMIARHRGMTEMKYKTGMAEVEDNLGQVYPLPRILLHAVDMIRGHIWKHLTGRPTKLKMCDFSIVGDWPVCSELWAQFLVTAGLDHGILDKKGKWKGVTPDDFYDAWMHRGDLWDVLTRCKVEKRDVPTL